MANFIVQVMQDHGPFKKGEFLCGYTGRTTSDPAEATVYQDAAGFDSLRVATAGILKRRPVFVVLADEAVNG